METEDKYIRALLLCALANQDSGDSILILNRAGFSNIEIAEILGMKANAVAMRILRSKSTKSAKGKTK
jgi:hypothetical protein